MLGGRVFFRWVPAWYAVPTWPAVCSDCGKEIHRLHYRYTANMGNSAETVHLHVQCYEALVATEALTSR